MEKLTSILAVFDPADGAVQTLEKAVVLARHSGAKLELFLCDAEHAYAMHHAYEARGVAAARQACLAAGRRYLEALRRTAVADDVEMSVDVVCESPLYEGIVRKVLRSRPDLVVKSAAGEQPLRRFTLDANDWQLARACPAPLMVLRGKSWGTPPRFAAAVDVSEGETAGLAREILQTGEYLSLGCRAELDLLYSERCASDPAGRARRAAALWALAGEHHVPAERVRLIEGEPEDSLPACAAREHYDVMVLGALTHRRGLTALVGTLTSQLVDALDCDFVLVKPSSYRCPLLEPAPAADARPS